MTMIKLLLKFLLKVGKFLGIQMLLVLNLVAIFIVVKGLPLAYTSLAWLTKTKLYLIKPKEVTNERGLNTADSQS